MTKLKLLPKIILIGLAVGAVGYGINVAIDSGKIKTPPVEQIQAQAPLQVQPVVPAAPAAQPQPEFKPEPEPVVQSEVNQSAAQPNAGLAKLLQVTK